MNAARRKKLEALNERLQTLVGQATDLRDELQELCDEEQDYYDAMPESLQGGDKGTKAEAAIASMEEVLDALSEFADVDVGALDEAIE